MVIFLNLLWQNGVVILGPGPQCGSVHGGRTREGLSSWGGMWGGHWLEEGAIWRGSEG